MTKRIVVLSLLMTLVLAACAPLPFVRTSKPEMAGIVFYNGSPVPDLPIIACAKGKLSAKCERVKRTLTDSQGQFYFAAEWDYERLVPYVGEQRFYYGLNFNFRGRDYHWNDSGVGDVPKSVNLRCEITSGALCTAEVTDP